MKTFRKFVVATDSFKGCLGSEEAGGAVRNALRGLFPGAAVELLPLSDGGEGFLVPFARRGGFEETVETVRGPLGDPVRARWLWDAAGRRAIVESAEACGLGLVPRDRRDPLRASSFGFGELLRSALERGAAEIVAGLGGSATNDGGLGMLCALGARPLWKDGKERAPEARSLKGIADFDLEGFDPRIAHCRFRAACDVRNPLLGPEGATRTYGAQKGASPRDLAELESGMRDLATAVHRMVFEDRSAEPGSGAAGGLGFAMRNFLGAELAGGAALVVRETGLREALEGADLFVTGEGAFDAQTLRGKCPGEAAKIARNLGVPVLLLCGRIGDPDAVRGLPEGVAVREITPRDLAPGKALEAETAKANLASAVREFFLREAGPDQAPTNAP